MKRLFVCSAIAAWCCAAYAGAILYHGPESVQCIYASADSSTAGWTVTGAASHFDGVNDAANAACLQIQTHDSDTTQITCPATTTCNDLFDLTDSSGLSTGKTILYVTASTVCTESSIPTNGNIAAALVVGGADQSIGNLVCSGTSYSEKFGSRLYTNPVTGVAWTSADVDALQLRVQRSSLPGTVTATSFVVAVAYEETQPFGSTRTRQAGGD